MTPAQWAYYRLPDFELTEELIGARLDGLAELPRAVFPLRPVDGLEVSAVGVWRNRAVGSGMLRVVGLRGVWRRRLRMVRTDAGLQG